MIVRGSGLVPPSTQPERRNYHCDYSGQRSENVEKIVNVFDLEKILTGNYSTPYTASEE